MASGIVVEFSPRKPILLTSRLSAGEAAEILLESAINDLWLTVCLRMIAGAHPKFHTLKLEEDSLEVAFEDFISVINYWGWNVMVSHHLSHKILATMSAVNGWGKEMKCAYLDSRSTTTMITECPWDRGSLSMKSIEMSNQMWSGIGSGCNSPAGFIVSDLDC